MQQTILFDEQYSPSQQLWEVPSELPYLTGVDRISMDTETSGKNPFKDRVCGISIAWRDDSSKVNKLYVPVAHSEGNLDPEMVKRWMEYVLPGKDVVFANAKFDVQMLKNGFGVDLEALGIKTHDVAFQAALLDDSRRADLSLDAIGKKYVGRGKVEFDGDMDKMSQYPSWMVGPYAEGDAALTLECNLAMMPRITSEGLDRVLALEDSLIFAVCELERNGCRIDVEKLELWRREIRAEYEIKIFELHKLTGMMIQPGTGESMNRLFSHLGIKPPPIKAKKNEEKKDVERAYSEDELLALKHPVVDIVVTARRYDSLLSKFLDKYHNGLDGDLLRSQFHQLKTDNEGNAKGTISGRFSSSGGGSDDNGFSFNAQQVIKSKLQRDTTGDHHIIRELFIPDSEGVNGEELMYFSADASQIEYRLAVHFANAKKIIKAYTDDPTVDYHGLILSHIKNYKPEFNDRTITKNVNFAFVFGAQAKRLAKASHLKLSEAEELLGICTKIFPEAPVLLKRLAQDAEKKGFVTTLFGRRCRFGKNDDRFYAAINRVVQGSAADIFKVELKALYDERKTLGIHKLRQVVHDEFDGDCLATEQTKKRMLEFFNEQRVDTKVPILWNLETGATWKDCH